MAKRVLIVTGQKPMATVKTKSGGDSTLYEVYATDEKNEIIEEPLRSFAELEEGVPIEYEISRYDHPQYGTSYTITPPKRNSLKRLRELEEEVERLSRWAQMQGYDRLELGLLISQEKASVVKSEPASDETPVAEPEPEPEPQPESVPAPRNDELDEKWGEEPPF